MRKVVRVLAAAGLFLGLALGSIAASCGGSGGSPDCPNICCDSGMVYVNGNCE